MPPPSAALLILGKDCVYLTRRDFEGYGVELTVSRDAVASIAQKAAEEKTGARGLVTVLERTFREFKY